MVCAQAKDAQSHVAAANPLIRLSLSKHHAVKTFMMNGGRLTCRGWPEGAEAATLQMHGYALQHAHPTA